MQAEIGRPPPRAFPTTTMSGFRPKTDEANGAPHRPMPVMISSAIRHITRDRRSWGCRIVIASDNGANAMIDGSGSNWPLRGTKGFLFEGGMRVHSMLYAPKLLPSHAHGRHYTGLFHVTDWLPTLVAGMLGNETAASTMDLDGANHWEAFKQLGKSGAVR